MTEEKKTKNKTVQSAKAHLPGRRYQEDKPRDCRYCYYWGGRNKGCTRRECWYLIPLPKKPEPKFDTNGVPIPNCKNCAYGRLEPCIGYCIAKVEREVFSKTRGWKPFEDTAEKLPEDQGGLAGVMT